MKIDSTDIGVFPVKVTYEDGQAFLHDAAEVAPGLRRNALHNEMVGIILRVGLGNIGGIPLAVTKLLLQNFNRILRVDIHRIVDLHLQDQVRSALQVEPQVNVVGQSCEQRLPTETLRNSEDPEQEEQHNADDE